jgi:hypothetical protein
VAGLVFFLVLFIGAAIRVVELPKS